MIAAIAQQVMSGFNEAEALKPRIRAEIEPFCCGIKTLQ